MAMRLEKLAKRRNNLTDKKTDDLAKRTEDPCVCVCGGNPFIKESLLCGSLMIQQNAHTLKSSVDERCWHKLYALDPSDFGLLILISSGGD